MRKELLNKFATFLIRTASFVFVVFIFSCNSFVEPNVEEFGYQYYPIEIGQYRIYFTQQINYNLDGSVETINYLVKEVVEDTVHYSDGSLKYILGRYSKELSALDWHKDSLWAAYLNQSTLVISEANLDYIKLAFPVKELLTWDGNALNGKDEEIYEINNLGQPYSYDTLNYQNTLTLIQSDLLDPNKITEDDYRVEVYAYEVGMVYKLIKKLNYCDPTKCAENGIIEEGTIFEQKLIEFGKE